ncbi:hypothetical protein BHM03_00058267 [Ensete ventricosum]|nr:hypothetical protein BHM03_00058267 [Ensete ventricosum]
MVDPPQRSKSIELHLGFYHLVSEQRSRCPCSHLYCLHLTKQFPQLLRCAPPPSTHVIDQINLLPPPAITEGLQPMLLLPFSSSTIAATLSCHPTLGDFTTAASTSLPLLPST